MYINRYRVKFNFNCTLRIAQFSPTASRSLLVLCTSYTWYELFYKALNISNTFFSFGDFFFISFTVARGFPFKVLFARATIKVAGTVLVFANFHKLRNVQWCNKLFFLITVFFSDYFVSRKCMEQYWLLIVRFSEKNS